MNLNRQKAILALLGLCAAVCLPAGQAAAQSRRQAGYSSPGDSFSTVGRTQATASFLDHSYGLGEIPKQVPGENVLRSSIGYAPNFSFNVGAAAPASQGQTLDPSRISRSVRVMSAGESDAPGLDRYRSGLPFIQDTEKLALSVANEYFEIIESSSTSLSKDSQPVTSLVPKKRTQFASLLEKGENAFSAGHFEEALQQYQFASNINSRIPESLVSLSHATFALSRYSYGRTAFYLREALKYFPELPLTPLRPRDFYGDPASFVDRWLQLEDHIQQHPEDVDALLMVAYFKWFDERPDLKGVRNALARALEVANREGDRYTIEAVETFWGGIVATGKASGQLVTSSEAKPPGEAETPATEKPAPGQGAEPTEPEAAG
ncbi:MAG: hypothetical protein ACYTF6_03500 [Planctomycetota bacterium]|jgi:hypothetical protein